jgi:hypothetical protein
MSSPNLITVQNVQPSQHLYAECARVQDDIATHCRNNLRAELPRNEEGDLFTLVVSLSVTTYQAEKMMPWVTKKTGWKPSGEVLGHERGIEPCSSPSESLVSKGRVVP